MSNLNDYKKEILQLILKQVSKFMIGFLVAPAERETILHTIVDDLLLNLNE
jgi:hypothetical protein